MATERKADATMTIAEVADTLEDFVEGRGGKWDWDNYLSCGFDGYLQRVQTRMNMLSEEFPAAKDESYCSAEGLQAIRNYVKELRLMDGPKQEILGKIRAAIGGGGSAEAAGVAWAGIRRGYQRSATLERGAVIELLVDRLRDYDAQVVEVGREGASQAVAKMLSARGVKRLVVPEGLDLGLGTDVMLAGFEFVVDDGLSALELNGVDGVVTECTLAIAETGTIVLQTTKGQGRRAITLVPDYHLCLVDTRDVVETVPEAMAKLQVTAGLATTFISGPSATADIEMTRIKGVHGPRFLDVVVMG